MDQEEQDRQRGKRERLREETMVRLAEARDRASAQAESLEGWVKALREADQAPMSAPIHEELKATYDEINAAKATLFNLSQGRIVSC